MCYTPAIRILENGFDIKTYSGGNAMATKTILPTIKSYVYTRILPKLKPRPQMQYNIPKGKDGQLPIVTICDPMTWENLCTEHVTISLTPHNWRDVLLANQKIRLFFCEAAWTGTTANCWRGQIYKDERVFYDNRRDLMNILELCNSKKIPTVFWAKEDPMYFQDKIYNFTDTAIHFDYILTTASECVAKYNALGHKHVYLWSFGFSPTIYFPPNSLASPRENVAVFAGSWYTDYQHRCNDLEKIFDTVLDKKISLRIYDRHRISGRSLKPFPAKYQPYVHDAISYDALGDVYRNVMYVINANTVSDSSTMFSRRIYEAMACGCIIITNESLGLRQQFGSNLWYIGEGFDLTNLEEIETIRNQNIDIVFSSHTWGYRMKQLCELIES